MFGIGHPPCKANITGTINSDPLSANPSLKDFHLMAGSPAATAGTTTPQPFDFDGIPLPQGSAYPIGAYAEISTSPTMPALAANPSSLSFAFQVNGAIPGSQIISITSSGSALHFTASASTISGGSWLSVTPATADTGSSLTVSLNPSGLAAGTYNGPIPITAAGASNNPVPLPVARAATPAPRL